MAILDQLRKATLDARKASIRKDWPAVGSVEYAKLTDEERAEHARLQALAPHAAFLQTLSAQIQTLAKNAKVEPTEQHAASALKAMAKSLQDSIAASGDTAFGQNVQAQLALISPMVPTLLDKDSLTLAITDAAHFLDTTPSMKEMGRIMARLNELHPGQIDGATVREIIQSGKC